MVYFFIILIKLYTLYIAFCLRSKIYNKIYNDFLKCCILLIRLYIIILDCIKLLKYNGNENDVKIKRKNFKNIDIFEYEVKYDNEIKKFKTLNKELNEIDEIFLTNLNKLRENILHMSIINKETDILIEITNEIKDFIYHHNDKEMDINLFLKYIEHKHKIEIDYINHCILIYNNNLEESKIKINEVDNMKFNEIFNIIQN